MARIEFRNIAKHFGKTIAVRELNMTVEEGEFVSLLGPSGCGKTTTLRIAAGLETPTEGEVLFDGEPVTRLSPAERNIAMVFQLQALYPRMTVRANLAFPLRAEGLPRSEIAERIERAARWMRIEESLDKMPSAIHPADGQRAAIAKAIVRDPAAFLFDEPFSRLDAQLRAQMRAEIKRIHSETKRAALFVTHDQAEALAISDRVAVMREGELTQIGTPEEIFDRPQHRYTAEFVGSPPINMLEAELAQENGQTFLRIGGQAAPVDADAPIVRHGARRFLLGVRPRQVTLTSPETGADGPRAQGAFRGEIDLLEPMGRETLAHARLQGGAEVRCLYPRRETRREGEAVAARFDLRRAMLFDPETGRALNASENGADQGGNV